MKRKNLKLSAVLVAAMSVSQLVSCSLLGENPEMNGEGQLRIFFTDSSSEVTRSVSEYPDTSDFILKVSDSKGDVIYEGKYGDSPEAMMVKAGNYTVSVISAEFSKPAFSAPQFGDEQCVMVPSGGVANVKLDCVQLNCGIRLDVDPSFLTVCPDAVLFLKSAQGKLMYGYSEDRIAYFLPGSISLVLSRPTGDEVLVTKSLKAQEIYVLGISAVPSDKQSSEKENISVAVDTSRVWISDSYVIGGDNGKGSGVSEALTVTQARSSVGKENVWVSGYIVGGDLSSSSASYERPFTSRTCILLGSRSSVSDRSSCISVQLPAGEVRDALNLVDNPSMLGRKVAVKGNIVASYYGLVGLKECSDYSL